MKNILNITTLFISILFISCTNGQSASKLLSAEEFSSKTKEISNAPIVDVRTPNEFADGHLVDAKNINWNSENFETEIATIDKDKPVFVYCLSGGRSSSATSKMTQLGFKHIYELDGGIKAWRKAKQPESK